MENGGKLAAVAQHVCLNPFTYAVELIRFALYGELNLTALAWVSICFVLFMLAALWGYDPARAMLRSKG